MTFDEERRALGVGIDGADVTSSELIDRYFSSVHAPPAPDDLGTYEELFRGQMATGVAAPVLLARRAGMDEDGVRDMHESFGVSWRMLDDLRDIETDAARGSRSAVYFALPMSRRHEWPPPRSRESFDTCLEREVMPLLTSRICDLLGHSARVARDLGLRIMAEQYEALRGPMQTRREK